jgi:hypothetical protein
MSVPARAGRPRAGHLCDAEIQESGKRRKIKPMRIYIFKSETRRGLRAFAGDPAGSKLPQQHGPWTAVGVVRPEAEPPHRFSRVSIERAIDDDGFQLWRLSANGTPA